MAKFTKQSVHEANLISIAIAIFILNAISNLESTVDCLTSTTKITNKNIKITMEKKGNRERRINKQWTKQRLLCCCWTWWYRRRRWRPRQRTSNNPISIILIPIQNGNWNNNNDDDDCNTTNLIGLQDVSVQLVDENESFIWRLRWIWMSSNNPINTGTDTNTTTRTTTSR